MNDGLKQRVVGAIVLVVLAVIFLPMAFNFSGERHIDRTSRIPERPVVEPVNVPEPVRPDEIKYPKPADKLYQFDKSRTELAAQAQQQESAAGEKPATEPKTQPEPQPGPALSKQGLPEGWVIQVGSFRESDKADKLEQSLLAEGYKAYTREARRQGFYRVYVGPNVDKKHALAAQRKIDDKYRVKSLLLKFEP